MMMYCRGIRGANSVEGNTKEAIFAATRELLEGIVAANDLDPADIASVFLTATPDLDADFPAQAARQLGWLDTALLCAQEMNVPGATPGLVRVLIHWNTPKTQAEVRHVYLNRAQGLRPDRVTAQ